MHRRQGAEIWVLPSTRQSMGRDGGTITAQYYKNLQRGTHRGMQMKSGTHEKSHLPRLGEPLPCPQVTRDASMNSQFINTPALPQSTLISAPSSYYIIRIIYSIRILNTIIESQHISRLEQNTPHKTNNLEVQSPKRKNQ